VTSAVHEPGSGSPATSISRSDQLARYVREIANPEGDLCRLIVAEMHAWAQYFGVGLPGSITPALFPERADGAMPLTTTHP
jgi:hypothetical protein